MSGDFDVKNSVARDTVLSHLVLRAFSVETMEKHRWPDDKINNLEFLREGWQRFDRAVGDLRKAGFDMDTIFAGAQVEELATAEPYGKRRPVLEWNETQTLYTEPLEDFVASLIDFKREKENSSAQYIQYIDYKEHLSRHSDAVLSTATYTDGTPQPNFEAAILIWKKSDCPVHTHGRDAAASYYVVDRHPGNEKMIEYEGQSYRAGSLIQQVWTVVCGEGEAENYKVQLDEARQRFGPESVKITEGLHGEKVYVIAKPENKTVVPPGSIALLEQGQYHRLEPLPGDVAFTINGYGTPARHREIKIDGPCTSCFVLSKTAACQRIRQEILDRGI